jgi:hypothetical protein
MGKGQKRARGKKLAVIELPVFVSCEQWRQCHQWTPAELLNFKTPPPRWELPKQRGRPSTAMLQLAQQWAN